MGDAKAVANPRDARRLPRGFGPQAVINRRRDDLVFAVERGMRKQKQRDAVATPGNRDENAVAAIDAHGWPGNVRELENRVKRAVIMADGKLVTAADLDLQAGNEGGEPLPLNLRTAREAADRRVIGRALVQAEGNISNTAKLLGVSRPTLYDLMRTYGLSA